MVDVSGLGYKIDENCLERRVIKRVPRCDYKASFEYFAFSNETKRCEKFLYHECDTHSKNGFK